MTLSINESFTAIKSLKASGRELTAAEQPLFLIRARGTEDESMLFSPETAEIVENGDTVSYRYPELTLYLTVKGGEDIGWSFKIENRSSLAVEFLDIANIEFSGALRKNGGDCAIVSSYNEGLMVEDHRKRPQMIDPEYPSKGNYMMYPYMLSAPLTMWLFADEGVLMHWEGTAPLAPPYVWPPYGGEDSFRALMDRLHADGNLLGVYCSGFGFTEQSNLISEYNCADMIRERELDKGFCKAPNQRLPHSNICRPQRSGYDICAASEVGREILNEAVPPLLKSGVDYVQVLDQNHGGEMYFCYAKYHGHPPVPGAWMTKATNELLDG